MAPKNNSNKRKLFNKIIKTMQFNVKFQGFCIGMLYNGYIESSFNKTTTRKRVCKTRLCDKRNEILNAFYLHP